MDPHPRHEFYVAKKQTQNIQVELYEAVKVSIQRLREKRIMSDKAWANGQKTVPRGRAEWQHSVPPTEAKQESPQLLPLIHHPMSGDALQQVHTRRGTQPIPAAVPFLVVPASGGQRIPVCGGECTGMH